MRLNKQRGVAQLVARLVRDQEVVGSNPVASTKNPKMEHSILGFFCLRDLRRDSRDELPVKQGIGNAL